MAKTLPLTLVHRLKNAKHLIPLDASKALAPESFAIYTETKAGEEKPLALGWVLTSAQTADAAGKKGKYEGHAFELLLRPEHLETFITCAQQALRTFNQTG
jgi:hypothetical protein